MHLSYYYQLYQLGTGGRTQKAKPVRGVYPKPRSLRNKWPNKLSYIHVAKLCMLHTCITILERKYHRRYIHSYSKNIRSIITKR